MPVNNQVSLPIVEANYGNNTCLELLIIIIMYVTHLLIHLSVINVDTYA